MTAPSTRTAVPNLAVDCFASANSRAMPPPIHRCAQLLGKLIIGNAPTWHAEEMRQLALASAVDTIVRIKLIQIILRQIQQVLLGCRK